MLIILFGSLYNIKAMDPNSENRISIEHLPGEMVREIFNYIVDPNFLDNISQSNIEAIKTINILRDDKPEKAQLRKEVARILDILKNKVAITCDYLNQFKDKPEELIDKTMELNTVFSRPSFKHLINPDSKLYNAEIAEEVNLSFLRAAKINHIEKIKFLTDIGVDLNIQDNGGDTALTLAAMYGNKEIVQFLFNIGKLDLNIQNKFGVTALMWIVVNGWKDIVEFLINNSKIDFNIQNKNRNSALIFAVIKNQGDIVRLLLRNSNINSNVKDSNGNTALMRAAMYGNKNMVNILLSNSKSDPNIQNNNGKTALELALSAGHKNIAESIKKYSIRFNKNKS